MNNNYQIKIATHGSDLYDQTVILRDRILRKPLNMVFTEEQLAAEKDQIHIACFEGDELVGCMILVPTEDHSMKMRQVAVDNEKQSKGVGRFMSEFIETYAQARGVKRIYCNARDTAVPFYHKMGYQSFGEPFIEVGIPHTKMEKLLT